MSNKKLSDHILEQFVLRELPEEKIEEIQNEVLLDESLKKRIEDIEKSNSEILDEYPSEFFVKKIKNRYNEISSLESIKTGLDFINMRKILYPALAVTTAIVLFVFNFYYESDRPVEVPVEITRVKGMETRLYIFKKKKSSIELLKNGSRAMENDLLQLAYVSPEDTHGVIFSIDGRGTVTLQYPNDPKTSTRIDPGRKKLLNRSYELDDAPNFERFYFVTSKSEIDVHGVLHRARRLAADPSRAVKGDVILDENLKQYSTLIIKGEKSEE